MTDKNVGESKASGEQPSDDLTALSVPSLRTALSFLVASVAILYPFGLLIFERQLQFAYSLDTPTAWHAVTVISQVEVVLHGLQVLAAPRTIQFGITFISFVVTIGLLSRTTYAYISVKRMAKNLWKTKRQYKWDPWANFTASQLKDMVRSTEHKLASLHVQLAERHAQEHVTTDRIDSLRHGLKGIEGRSSEPIEDLIRRTQVVSLRQQLNEEYQTLETARTLITSTEKAIAHQQEMKPMFQEALAAKIMDATPPPDIKQETLSLPWHIKLMLWVVPSLLLALVGYQSLVQPPTILDKILALLLVVPTSSIGAGLAYRHFQLSDDNYFPPSIWLLWSAIFSYFAALTLAYFSTTASPNGLLPFATVSTQTDSVCGALLNVSDLDWYIIQSPRLNTLCRPSRPTSVPQVRVVFNFETTGVVFGLPPGISMYAPASVHHWCSFGRLLTPPARSLQRQASRPAPLQPPSSTEGVTMSPRLRALRCVSDHLQQQPHGPDFTVSGDELYTWLRTYLTQAGHRQRPVYAYEANRLYCAIANSYRYAANYVATDRGQDFFDVAALHDAVRRTTMQDVTAHVCYLP